MKRSRQFQNLVRREGRKLEVEMRRWKGRPQFLPVRAMFEDKRWSLGWNSFRRMP